MKPLEQLTNVEKARILHQLFPAEIPEFLQFVQNMSITIIEEQERIKATWKHLPCSFACWMHLALEASDNIEHYEKKMHRNGRLFADQLFDGHNTVYLVYCLRQYTEARIHPNEKFILAVQLLFA
ncbi:MAG: hypothetical protein EOO04_02220 [Chitinophagaceae bacterium]|nr:MAG: hypothetical protein EOO04_02220 [Chitinophagaceae bacterium]